MGPNVVGVPLTQTIRLLGQVTATGYWFQSVVVDKKVVYKFGVEYTP